MKEKKQTETETKIANTNNQREKQELTNPKSASGKGFANRIFSYRIALSR